MKVGEHSSCVGGPHVFWSPVRLCRMLTCSHMLQAQNGSTALHNAAANGHAKAVEALVAAPACDCDVQNSNGNTALHLAASKGQAPYLLPLSTLKCYS